MKKLLTITALAGIIIGSLFTNYINNTKNNKISDLELPIEKLEFGNLNFECNEDENGIYLTSMYTGIYLKDDFDVKLTLGNGGFSFTIYIGFIWPEQSYIQNWVSQRWQYDRDQLNHKWEPIKSGSPLASCDDDIDDSTIDYYVFVHYNGNQYLSHTMKSQVGGLNNKVKEITSFYVRVK